MTEQGWVAFLDTMETSARAVSRDADGQLAPIQPFLPPNALGPLPGSMQTRAREVLQTIRGAETLVKEELERTGRQMREVRQMSPKTPSLASAIDMKA